MDNNCISTKKPLPERNGSAFAYLHPHLCRHPGLHGEPHLVREDFDLLLAVTASFVQERPPHSPQTPPEGRKSMILYHLRTMSVNANR